MIFVPASAGSDSMSHSYWRRRHQVARLVAAENRRQVEAKAVHVHGFDPVAETVDDQAADDRMIGVERVAGAAVIGVARPIFLKDVVGAVVQPTETQRRPGVVAFRGVVEDDVENDLDARPMQRLDHVAKLVNGTQRVLTRAVALVRRKE